MRYTAEKQQAESAIPGAYRIPRNAVEASLDPTHGPLFSDEEAAERPPDPDGFDQIIVVCSVGLASSLFQLRLTVSASAAPPTSQACQAAGPPVDRPRPNSP